MSKEEKRKAARMMKGSDHPKYVDKTALGESILRNKVDTQIDEEQKKQHEDTYRLTKPKEISENYDLGHW